MFALIMGHRRGLSKALEKAGVPYGVWSATPPVNKLKTEHVLISPFVNSKEEALELLKDLPEITHIIAGTEESVVPASQLRLWTGARRNNHSTVVRCADKLKMKEHLLGKEVPMTDFMNSKNEFSPEEVFERLGAPIISKRRYSSGGRALERIFDKEALISNSKTGRILEKAIVGTEGSVESFILDGEILFTNITQYAELGAINIVPGDYCEELSREIIALNQRVIESLNLDFGITHLEFYITKDGVLFGEVANRPPGGYIMNCLELAYGFNPWEKMVEIELGNKTVFPASNNQFSASLVMPKIKGEVKNIEGESSIKNITGLKKFKVKVKEGDIVGERAGLGDDIGHALFASKNKDSLKEAIESFKNKLKIEIN